LFAVLHSKIGVGSPKIGGLQASLFFCHEHAETTEDISAILLSWNIEYAIVTVKQSWRQDMFKNLNLDLIHG